MEILQSRIKQSTWNSHFRTINLLLPLTKTSFPHPRNHQTLTKSIHRNAVLITDSLLENPLVTDGFPSTRTQLSVFAMQTLPIRISPQGIAITYNILKQIPSNTTKMFSALKRVHYHKCERIHCQTNSDSTINLQLKRPCSENWILFHIPSYASELNNWHPRESLATEFDIVDIATMWSDKYSILIRRMCDTVMKMKYDSLASANLTYWGINRMDEAWQTTFSNVFTKAIFSWFQLYYIFQGAHLPMSKHRIKSSLEVEQAPVHLLN